MADRPTVLERALTLATSGDVASLTELKACLRKEGYGNEANGLFGKGLKMQLIKLVRCARMDSVELGEDGDSMDKLR